jgi:aspartate dehydrogenase
MVVEHPRRLLHNALTMCTYRTEKLPSGERAVKGEPAPCRLAVIGGGAVAASICAELLEEPGAFTVVGALVRSPSSGLPGEIRRIEGLDELIAARPDVVVEAASSAAVAAYCPALAAAGIHLVLISSGALLDAGVRGELHARARAAGAQVVIASGAIAGIDALRAARVGGLDEVEVEQRKPARTLLPAAQAAALEQPIEIFAGTVQAAVAAYPATTNILATIALAGIGPEATTVRIVADPRAIANSARLRARGTFGSLDVAIENRPSANPRSSLLTAMSITSVLRERFTGGGLAWPGAL